MKTTITSPRCWAWLCIAAGVALVNACGGGNGRGSDSSSVISEPALPPETTAYAAQTSVKLGFTASATGAGAGPLRFGLAAAPDGVRIDEQSGSVEWVPQPAQIGAHELRVTVTDGTGATVDKTYRVTVAAPEGSPAYLVLRTEASTTTVGATIRVSWRIGGDMPANASIELGVLAPGADAGATDDSILDWSLDEQGRWLATPVKLRDAAREGSASFTLPNRLTGTWQIATRLRDEAGQPRAAAAQRVLVADAPTLRLALNRPLANPLDAVRADVAIALGATPLPTRLLAWLVRPDGSVLGLPAQLPDALEVQRGDTESGRYRLLDQEFADDELGEYRIHARLYAAADGRLLQEASQRFTVCAVPGAVAGRVLRPDRSPVDGSAAGPAAVRAFDLDDAGITASAAITASGGYALSLPAGRYLLQARVNDGAGAELRVDSDLLTVGCGTAGLNLDLTLQAR